MQVLQRTPNYHAKKSQLEVFEVWEPVVGEKIARNAKPVRLLDDGTLFVLTSNNAWQHQLRYLEGQILDKLKAKLGDSRVKALRFKIGSSREILD